jgi:hypothetical protein
MVEMMVESTSSSSNVHGVVDGNINPYKNMVMDAMRMNQDRVGQHTFIDEEPHADTTMFFDLLKDSNELLQDGCINHNKLSVVAQVFIIKSYHGVE